MKLLLLCTAFLTLAGTIPAQSAAPAAGAPTAITETLRKISARYARTEERIAFLVGRRLSPQPLPATLPNPFYRGVETSELATLDVTQPTSEADSTPAAPDITDADTLARLVPTLRITGLVIRNQQPHLTINSISCKAGDVIPIGSKDAPVFLQVRKITPDSLTLGLNDAELTIPLKL